MVFATVGKPVDLVGVATLIGVLGLVDVGFFSSSCARCGDLEDVPVFRTLSSSRGGGLPLRRTLEFILLREPILNR